MAVARFLEFLVLAVLPAVVQAPRHKDICGFLHSSIALPTSFDPGSVQEVRWSQKSSHNEKQIAKFPPAGQNPQYKLLNNGTILVKPNLTEEDIGVYTCEATFPGGELRYETFNVTICVQAPHHKDICGFLHSSIALPTSFDPSSVQEVRWSQKSSHNETQIAKFPPAGQNPQYKLLNNGTILVKTNLTEEDIGVCTSEATFPGGELRNETFNVTICGDPYDEAKNEDLSPTVQGTQKKRSRLVIIASVITVLGGFVVVMWTCWKRSSDTNGQGDQQNEAEGENLRPPVQDTESQESTIITITRGKPDMETKEKEEEDSKLEDEPSCDHNSVC